MSIGIFLVLTSLFYAIISYYALITSETYMGFVLGGASIFFLLIFIFQFDWGKRRTSTKR